MPLISTYDRQQNEQLLQEALTIGYFLCNECYRREEVEFSAPYSLGDVLKLSFSFHSMKSPETATKIPEKFLNVL